MKGIVLHTMATPELTPRQALDLAARLGLDGVEVVYQDDYPCGLAPGTPQREVTALGEHAAGVGQQVAGLVPYLPDLDAEDDARRRAALDETGRVVELAATLGCGSVRVLAGHDVAEPGRTEARRRLVASLQELAGLAAPHGVALNVENHMDTLATSAAETMAIVTAVGAPNVGVLYDQSNLTFMGAEDHVPAIRLQGASTGHVHVKNFRPRGTGRVPAAPDDGVVPWAAVLDRLHASGYDGYLSLEYERRWFPDDLPPAETGIPVWRDQLRRLVTTRGEGQRCDT